MGVYLSDLKTGFVGYEARLQLGAYGLCTKIDGTPLPPLDGALILHCNDKEAEPIWIGKDELVRLGQRFVAVKGVWDDLIAANAIKNSDTYQLFFEGMEVVYPRVTSVIKGVIARPHLVNWQIKQAIRYTLKQMQQYKRSAEEVLDAFESGFFNPQAGAKGYMESRGDEGQRLHKCFEAVLQGQEVLIPPDHVWLDAAFRNLTKLLKDLQIKLVPGFSEFKVVNRAAAYAGTGDAIVEATR